MFVLKGCIVRVVVQSATFCGNFLCMCQKGDRQCFCFVMMELAALSRVTLDTLAVCVQLSHSMQWMMAFLDMPVVQFGDCFFNLNVIE
jgi:hypothetical protein